MNKLQIVASGVFRTRSRKEEVRARLPRLEKGSRKSEGDHDYSDINPMYSLFYSYSAMLNAIFRYAESNAKPPLVLSLFDAPKFKKWSYKIGTQTEVRFRSALSLTLLNVRFPTS